MFERTLSPSEIYCVRLGNIILGGEMEGRLCLTKLQQVLEILAAQHPFLRGVVKSTADTDHIVEGKHQVPLMVLTQVNSQAQHNEKVQTLFAEEPNPTQHLFKCVVMHAGGATENVQGQFYLYLMVSHIIADGACCVALLNELIQLLGQEILDQYCAQEIIPEALETLIEQTLQQQHLDANKIISSLPTLASQQSLLLPQINSDNDTRAYNQVIAFKLDLSLVKKIIEALRSRHLKLGAYVIACYCDALSAVTNAKDQASLNLRAAVNLRQRLIPAQPAAVVDMLAGGAVASVGREKNFWQLVQDINDKLHGIINSDTVFGFSLVIPKDLRAPHDWCASSVPWNEVEFSLTLSDMGVIEFAESEVRLNNLNYVGVSHFEGKPFLAMATVNDYANFYLHYCPGVYEKSKVEELIKVFQDRLRECYKTN